MQCNSWDITSVSLATPYKKCDLSRLQGIEGGVFSILSSLDFQVPSILPGTLVEIMISPGD